jgi:hypothetical protein
MRHRAHQSGARPSPVMLAYTLVVFVAPGMALRKK